MTDSTEAQATTDDVGRMLHLHLDRSSCYTVFAGEGQTFGVSRFDYSDPSVIRVVLTNGQTFRICVFTP